MPVTCPAKPRVACVLLALHVPPLLASASTIVPPVHTIDGPVIGAVRAATVTVFVATLAPQLIVIV
jgi:hypothetical protein